MAMLTKPLQKHLIYHPWSPTLCHYVYNYDTFSSFQLYRTPLHYLMFYDDEGEDIRSTLLDDSTLTAKCDCVSRLSRYPKANGLIERCITLIKSHVPVYWDAGGADFSCGAFVFTVIHWWPQPTWTGDWLLCKDVYWEFCKQSSTSDQLIHW